MSPTESPKENDALATTISTKPDLAESDKANACDEAAGKAQVTSLAAKYAQYGLYK